MEENLTFCVAGSTDPGGSNKTNQDDYFIWRHPTEAGCMVLGMLDGHGREVGHIASQTASRALQDQLAQPRTWELLRNDPKRAFTDMFERAHEAIKQAFIQHYESNGWSVSIAAEGYLLRKGKSLSRPGCVHGGTTVSVVVVLDGRKLLIGLLAGLIKVTGCDLVPITATAAGGEKVPGSKSERFSLGDEEGCDDGDSEAKKAKTAVTAAAAAAQPPTAPPQDSGHSKGSGAGSGGSNYDSDAKPVGDGCAGSTYSAAGPGRTVVLISADHSPESPDELFRIRRFRPNPTDGLRPELLMVYDAPSYSKSECPDIFTIYQDGTAKVNNCGKYYKNVRHEWASLVTTPSHAAFQDALAFTRSLGDFHLQTYGVSTEPDVFSLDLAAVMAREETTRACGGTVVGGSGALVGGNDSSDDAATGDDARGRSGEQHSPECDAGGRAVGVLALCSDGVWDNWRYEDVGDWLMQPDRLAQARTGQQGMQQVADAFMRQNFAYGKQNFGSQADNMTAIVCYVSRPTEK